MHTREYNEIFGAQDQGSAVDSNVRTDDAEGIRVVSSNCKQHQWNTSIAKNLVVKCNLPLTLVQNPAFRNFVKDLNPRWEPISSKTLKSNLIPKFVEDVRATIQKTLVSLTDITITVDAWTDRRCRSFLGFTAHFIDKNFIPQVFLIDFVRFKSPHTGEKIQQMTEDVLDRFGLKEKVFRIVTDNASTMIKAYEFGLSVDEEIRSTDDQPQLIPDGNMIFGEEEGEWSFHPNPSTFKRWKKGTQ